MPLLLFLSQLSSLMEMPIFFSKRLLSLQDAQKAMAARDEAEQKAQQEIAQIRQELTTQIEVAESKTPDSDAARLDSLERQVGQLQEELQSARLSEQKAQKDAAAEIASYEKRLVREMENAKALARVAHEIREVCTPVWFGWFATCLFPLSNTFPPYICCSLYYFV